MNIASHPIVRAEKKTYTVKRLRLRLQICLNLTPVTICLNFGLIVYFIETQVNQPILVEAYV